MTVKVAIIVLNYQAPAATLACLASLQGLKFPKEYCEIHLVDNASGDHSVDVFKEMYPDIPVHVSLENRGYAAGNNIVVQQLLSRGDITHFWILNNDCEVLPESLSALMDVSIQNPNALVGSVIQYPDGRFQRIGRYLKKIKTDLKDYPESYLQQGQDAIAVESLTGCSWLIPAPAFKLFGLLPEEYFLYYEDNAFCFKVREQGWQCLVAKKSVVLHAESLTAQRQKPLSAYYYQRARLMFFKNCQPPIVFRWVMLYSYFRLLRTLSKALLSKPQRRYYRAISMALSDFKKGITGPCPKTPYSVFF